MQSDVEKLEGLPVAPFMDREKVSHAVTFQELHKTSLTSFIPSGTI